MWNPVTITALVGAVGAAAVAIITALRSSNVAAKQVARAMANHYAVAHPVQTDFEKRVHPE